MIITIHGCKRKAEDSISSKFKEYFTDDWSYKRQSSRFCENLIYYMSWVSISGGCLFWDVSCCREIKGVNCYVSHYLKNSLAFLKGRGGDKPSCASPSLGPHGRLPLAWKKSCGTSGLLESKTSWWPLKIHALVVFLFGTLCPKSFMCAVNPIITQLTLKEGTAA